jgi:hypothetical protein
VGCTNNAANGFPVPWVARQLDSLPGEAWSAVPPTAPPKKPNGQRFRVGPFLMGLGKRRRERRSRHLGVVGVAVGCAPGGGVVGHPPDGTPCRHNGQRFRVGPFLHCRCRKWLGVAIMFLALAPLCPGGRPLEDEIVALIPA